MYFHKAIPIGFRQWLPTLKQFLSNLYLLLLSSPVFQEAAILVMLSTYIYAVSMRSCLIYLIFHMIYLLLPFCHT